MSSIHKIVENVSLKREFYRQGIKLVYDVIFRGLYRGNEGGFRKLQTAKSPVRQYRAFTRIILILAPPGPAQAPFNIVPDNVVTLTTQKGHLLRWPF
ncbi:hypothetical protein [Buttiauxella noackiae]|uniref:hypothetical protein n=1 Tax=Buttiauxella noackiae TaxID=82992 RepID=UPI00235656C3|nr:hypothetical protein [Buttiauxella noackiae]